MWYVKIIYSALLTLPLRQAIFRCTILVTALTKIISSPVYYTQLYYYIFNTNIIWFVDENRHWSLTDKNYSLTLFASTSVQLSAAAGKLALFATAPPHFCTLFKCLNMYSNRYRVSCVRFSSAICEFDTRERLKNSSKSFRVRIYELASVCYYCSMVTFAYVCETKRFLCLFSVYFYFFRVVVTPEVHIGFYNEGYLILSNFNNYPTNILFTQ